MIITINGNIVDTEYIYMISEIYNDWDTGIEDFVDQFQIYFIGKGNFITIVNKDKEKLFKFRQSIMDIWLKNQSKIPQFNI